MEYQVKFWNDPETGDWNVQGDWPWDHFAPSEVACKCGKHNSPMTACTVNIKAMNALEALRERLGHPLVINSAYRCPVYNERVGGASNSMHKQGRAFDIGFNSLEVYGIGQLAKVLVHATQCGFAGFGIYEESKFMHMDTGPLRIWEQAGSFFDDEGTI